MSSLNKKELEENKWEIEFNIESSLFLQGLQSAYKKNIKKINVQGFRKGKAPMGIVEKLYGEKIFFDDAIDIILPEAYKNAIDESGLTPVSRPSIDIMSASKEKGVDIKAVIYTKPNIDISNYKGIEVEKAIKKVSKDDIKKEIDIVRERNSRLVTVEERAAKDGDITIIDFEGFCDGVAFDGGKSQDHSLTLGSGQFIPGFEEQIIGKKVGKQFDVNVTFPTEYHAKELAGKDCVFKVTLNKIQEKQLPDLDDEFAKDVSEFDTLKEYEDSIKKSLTDKNQKEADEEVENLLVNEVIKNIKGNIPEIMYDLKADDEMHNFEHRLESQGMRIDLYLQYTGTTLEMLKATFKEQAVRQIKIRLALEIIVEIEKIETSDNEVEEEYVKISERSNMAIDEVKKHIKVEDLKLDISVNKAIDFIRDNAVIKNVEKKAVESKKSTSKKDSSPKQKAEEKEKPKKTVKKSTAKSSENEKSVVKVKKTTKNIEK